MINFRNLSVAFLLGFIGLCRVAAAQELTVGTSEVHGYVGGVSGGGGATFGGGYSKAIRERLLVGGEVGYMTLGGFSGDAFNFGSFGTSSIDTKGLEFGVNAHYLFPLQSRSKFTPYVLGGLGVVRLTVDVNVAGTSGSGSNTDFGLNLGGGARWQVGSNWGVKPELKFFISSGNFTRGSVTIYYQFGK